MNVSAAYKKLIDCGLIEYGTMIPAIAIERALNVKYERSWNFLHPFLDLKEAIESDGYFCTSRGCEEGALRILPVEEMSVKAQKIQDQMLRKQKKVIHVMSAADVSTLQTLEKSKHDMVTLKFSLTLQSMRSILAGI